MRLAQQVKYALKVYILILAKGHEMAVSKSSKLKSDRLPKLKKVSYDSAYGCSYLTEDRLYEVLCAIFGTNKVSRQVKLEAKNGKVPNLRFDFAIKSNKTILIEFDGATHYRDVNVQTCDTLKERLCLDLNLSLIRIPYWLQLDNIMFEHFFGHKLEKLGFTLNVEFPHGFVDSKATLIGDFNYYGLARFKRELKSLPKYVKKAVIETISNRSTIFWDKYNSKLNSYGIADYIVDPLLSPMIDPIDDAELNS
jgi:hypothetical protein